MHRCKGYKLYSPDAMKEALVSIKLGMKMQQASIKFNIPLRTLYHRFQINKKNYEIENYLTELRLRGVEVKILTPSNIKSTDEDVLLSLLLYGFEEEMTT